jgi:hypothetical protein
VVQEAWLRSGLALGTLGTASGSAVDSSLANSVYVLSSLAFNRKIAATNVHTFRCLSCSEFNGN